MAPLRSELPPHLKPFLEDGHAVSVLGEIWKNGNFEHADSLSRILITSLPKGKKQAIAEMLEKHRGEIFTPRGFKEIDSGKLFGYGERLGTEKFSGMGGKGPQEHEVTELLRNVVLGYVAHNQPLEELIKHFRQ